MKIRVLADRRRFPLPLRPRVGARFPRRRESPLLPFGLRVLRPIPSPRAPRRPLARLENPRGMAIGRLRLMVIGSGKEKDFKCALRIIFFAPKSGFWGWVATPCFK